jgi:hypothetical protein
LGRFRLIHSLLNLPIPIFIKPADRFIHPFLHKVGSIDYNAKLNLKEQSFFPLNGFFFPKIKKINGLPEG